MRLRLTITFIILSFIGFLDSSFLALEHFLHRIPPCNLVTGCATVTTSQYSLLFGVPVALLGAIYYLVFFLGSVFVATTDNGRVFKLLCKMSIVGLIASAWFVYVQLFILHALCLYCLASAATSTALFILGMFYLSKNRIEIKESF